MRGMSSPPGKCPDRETMVDEATLERAVRLVKTGKTPGSDETPIALYRNCEEAMEVLKETVRAIDFDGCGGWLSEYAIVELTESCVEMFPSLTSLAWPRARALTGRGVSRALTACGWSCASARGQRLCVPAVRGERFLLLGEPSGGKPGGRMRLARARPGARRRPARGRRPLNRVR